MVDRLATKVGAHVTVLVASDVVIAIEEALNGRDRECEVIAKATTRRSFQDLRSAGSRCCNSQYEARSARLADILPCGDCATPAWASRLIAEFTKQIRSLGLV
jgi:hypothetical protein